MKKIASIIAVMCLFCACAMAQSTIQVSVGEMVDIIGFSGAEESVWYSEDDAIATVSGGISSCTVTGIAPGTVNVVQRYVVSEPFSEYDPDLGKNITGTRSVTKKDYYSVTVMENTGVNPVDSVTSPTEETEIDTITSATGYSDVPVPTAAPKENGEYDYEIFLTDESRREMKNYDTLKPGDKGKAVKKMKERLVELGYLFCEGKITNKYDDVTEMAVYDFQISNNLTGSDGVAYAYTQYKLFDEFAIPFWGSYYFDMSIGDSGWEVERLQRRLCDIGYLDEEYVNGDFQIDTMDAVRIFQENNGFEGDGIAWEWLQHVIFSSEINSYREE